MATEETYAVAEKALMDWIDLCISHKLSMCDIVFMLQFRIFDINSMTREAYFTPQQPSKGNNDERTDSSI